MPGQKNKSNPFSSSEELEKTSQEKPQKKEQEKPIEFSTSVFAREVFDLKRGGEKLVNKEKQETRIKLQEIRQELANLIRSLSPLKKETEKAIKQETVDPGIYHQIFLDQLKETIVFLRLKTEESINWFQTLSTRNKRKKGYWANAKKSGSRYILSGERTSATQTV